MRIYERDHACRLSASPRATWGAFSNFQPLATTTMLARRRDPARLSARVKRDMALKVEVRRLFKCPRSAPMRQIAGIE